MSKQIELLQARRFLPLFVSQMFSAFNDNLFKSAFVMLVTFGAASGGGLDPAVLAALAGAALIAPFFLFSALAGECADRFERSHLMRWLKVFELAAVLVAVSALLTGSLALSLGSLFLLGMQSAFSSPIKYALLPQHLGPAELVDGNAVMEAGTFLSILVGTIAGGLAPAVSWGTEACCAILLLCAALGLAASFGVPLAPAPAPELRVRWNPVRANIEMLRLAHERREVWLSIVGASWFWLVGAVFLSQLPSFAKVTLGAGSGVVTLFLAAFSIGVGIGSTLCGRLMHGEVSARYAPLAALGMAVFSLDLALASRGGIAIPGAELEGVVEFMSRGIGLRLFIDLAGIAVSGGIFIVPLYAIMQSRSPETARARIVASNNIVNALFMTGAAIATAVLLASGLGIPDLFLILAIATFAAALWVCKLLPAEVLRPLARLLLRLCYRVEVKGLENVAAAGDRAVIVPNHVSYLDGALIASFLPGSPMFAIDTAQSRKWWVRPLLAVAEFYPMDPAKPMATKSLVRAIRDGRSCVIFPEGRLNSTGGALMKIYDGPALIADRSDTPVLPVRLDGVEFTPFSRLAGRRLRQRWFPKITITILPARRLAIPEGLRGRARRQAAGTALYDAMAEMMALRPDPPSLFGALLQSRIAHGGAHRILQDPLTTALTYDRVIAASLVLGKRLVRQSRPGETIGIMLPNAVGTALAFLGLQAHGRVPAMLNHTAGPDGVASACRTAGLRRIVSSRRFVELAKLDALVARLQQQAEIVWLEDIRDSIGLFDRLYGAFAGRHAARLHARCRISRDDPAVVLFTSGSEGAPKGVVLSHANLLANRRQLSAVIDFSPADRVLNALPMFHSFGLTGGFILPLLAGVPCVLYPSPLHYRIVPEVAYDTAATILFGTDTFLTGYARAANPYDFYALRYVFAGAEPVRDETRRAWHDRFGKRILEGYGVTECAPVIAVNTPMHFRAGSVGRLLPLMQTRLETVPGIETGGRLHLHGPNVMLGYLLADNPGVLVPPPEGWHDTGDIVAIDADGYMRIAGRAKRFAKVAGEMVSLVAAERIAQEADPAALHAVTALPDARKGEKLVLLTESASLTREKLLAAAQRIGAPEIALPREIRRLDALPLLGSGKIDYAALARLAAEAEGADQKERSEPRPEPAVAAG